MNLAAFIYTNELQQGPFDSTKSITMLFSLLPSCVQITIPDRFTLLQGIISAGIFIRYYCIMKNSIYLSLDFKERFPHITV